VYEEDGIPWTAALEGFSYLVSMLQSGPGLAPLQSYLLALLESTYGRLGFAEQPTDSFLDRRLRVQVQLLSIIFFAR
jgi:hypothetical protein